MNRKIATFLLLPVLPLTAAAAALMATPAGASPAGASPAGASPATAGAAVTTSSLGQNAPTFTGPAATGCAATGCDLLTGPIKTPSTEGFHGTTTAAIARKPVPHAMPSPLRPHAPAGAIHRDAGVAPPTVSCAPLGPGCDTINTSASGAFGVRGLNAVDSATQAGNPLGTDVEPPDQGLCASSQFVVESNNIGQILVFNRALNRVSSVIPLDTVMGLGGQGFSSGGDPSCVFDHSHGGHWFFTEIVSTNTEASGGAFTGCFAAVASSCLEGIAVTTGSSPFGPYNVYFQHADYNPGEPGYPFLLNDFAKIGLTQDAFMIFYDEFPLNPSVGGFGGGAFNGAQELAYNKAAMEFGLPVSLPNGKPDPLFNVAIENMGLLPTPDGTCAGTSGVDCWAAAIPAQPPDPSQFDNNHGGSGFMMAALDFNNFAGLTPGGDNRFAVFDWTGLRTLNTVNCFLCSGIRFGGQLFSNTLPYNGSGALSAQKTGPIPLGNECGAAGLSVSPSPGTPPPANCPENGVATNGDFVTEVSQASGQLWGGTATAINQTFSGEPSPELRQGVIYWVVGTNSFDRTGVFTLSSQGYVSAAHEDLSMPDITASGLPFQDGGNGAAVMTFTLSGDGGPTHADNGGFFPSTAFGRVTSTSGGLSGSVMNVADAGQSPVDGAGEYAGFPGRTGPRWGDYSAGQFVPGDPGTFYFANEYIQFPNCAPPAFTLTLATCGGTRDGIENWGTSVNSAPAG